LVEHTAQLQYGTSARLVRLNLSPAHKHKLHSIQFRSDTGKAGYNGRRNTTGIYFFTASCPLVSPCFHVPMFPGGLVAFLGLDFDAGKVQEAVIKSAPPFKGKNKSQLQMGRPWGFYLQGGSMNLQNLQSIASAAQAAQHFGHRHFARRLLSRRGFLEKTGLTVGALAASGLITGMSRSTLLNAATNNGRGSTTTAVPQPIPGGLNLLGNSEVFHLFLPQPEYEPSTITNFNGFVGGAAVGGTGTHRPAGGPSAHLVFEADVRFLLGEFVGADGRNHHGAFAFI